MKNKTATIIGATGLIGSHLLDLLQNDTEFSVIKVLVRRPVAFNNPKVKVAIVDFTNLESYKSEINGSSVVFCAVGTTNKKMKGDKNEYRKTDYDIPVNAAKLSLETGCPQFVFVSSLGANSKSNNFYLKLKGEVEDTLCSLNIQSLLIFRPSLLIGKRRDFRFGEIIGKILIKPISFLFPTNMRPIKAYYVAKSMIEASKLDTIGINTYNYQEMKQLINK